MKKRDDLAVPHSSAPGLIILVVLLLIIFGAILYWMCSVRLLILPDFITDLLGLPSNDRYEVVPWDSEALEGAVRNGKSTEKVEISFDTSYENLRAALLGEPEPEGIYQSVRISYYYDDQVSERRVILTRWGDRFRIEKYADDSYGSLVELIVGDGTTASYYDEATGLSRSLPLPDDYSCENEAGIPSVETLLDILEEFPDSVTADTDAPDSEAIDTSYAATDAIESGQINALDNIDSIDAEISDMDATDDSDISNSDIMSDAERYTDCELMLLYTENGNVYYLAFNDNKYATREEYYISLDCLMITEHNTYFQDKLLYSCKTLSYSQDPEVYAREDEYILSKK